jgi:bacterioferritin-associated ferredoxin
MSELRSMATTQTYHVKVEDGDEIHLEIHLENTHVISTKWQVIGCHQLTELAQSFRAQAPKNIAEWTPPSGSDHASMLLRELILKVQGRWNFPYNHDELCHCRAISTRVVDRQIVMGGHRASQISRLTSAGTGCGTCRSDIEAILLYRKQA